MRFSPLPLLSLVSLCGALVVSSMLLVTSLDQMAGRAGGGVCGALFGGACDATLASSASTVAGIPLAGFGVVGAAAILGLLVAGRALGEEFRRHARAAVTGAFFAGAGIAGFLLLLFAAGRVPFCPLCAVADSLFIGAAAAWGAARGRGLGEDVRLLARGLRYILGGRTADPAAARWHAAGFLLVAVSAVAAYQWILVEADRARGGGRFDRAEFLARFDASRVHDVPPGPDDGAAPGPPPKAVLTVFSDAFCPHCRDLWRWLNMERGRWGGDLRVVHRHFPLDAACNAASPETIHPGACIAARALEAARRQSRFEGYAEALARPGVRQMADAFRFTAAELGLDVERFSADLERPEIEERIREDVELGRRLGVTATPTVFLNGRRVEEVSARALGALFEHLMGR